MKDEKIRYFSMFTGVGGFELGIESVSKEQIQIQRVEGCNKETTNIKECIKPTFCCVGFSEIDKYANQLLAKRFPNIPNFGDATKINPGELPDFDMLCGGFPCQSFSIAGKRRGFQDTRGTMFFHIARILEVKRPKIVFLENVKGLLNHDKGKTFKVIIQTLSELGYDVQWMVLNSKFFGVPQNRERVFIIGSIRGEPKPEILPFRTMCEKTILQPEVSHTLISGYWKGARGTTMIQRIQGDISGKGYKSQQDRVYFPDGVSPCIPTCRTENKLNIAVHSLYPRTGNPDVGGTGHLSKQDDTTYCLDSGNCQALEFEGMKIRRLTPIECERLQGFPDNWTEGFSDTQRYKMMGNAVTVNVIKEIGRQIFRK